MAGSGSLAVRGGVHMGIHFRIVMFASLGMADSGPMAVLGERWGTAASGRWCRAIRILLGYAQNPS